MRGRQKKIFMDSKAKWQLDFEAELSLLNNEDLLSRWDDLAYCVSNSYSPKSRFRKKCDLAYKEILHRMSYWTFNGGSLDPMGN